MTSAYEAWYAKQMRELAKKEGRPTIFTWSAPRPVSDEVLDGTKSDVRLFLHNRWASQRQIRLGTKRSAGAVGLALRELRAEGLVETKDHMNGRYRFTLYTASPATGASEPAAPGQEKGDHTPTATTAVSGPSRRPRQQAPVASPAAGADGVAE